MAGVSRKYQKYADGYTKRLKSKRTEQRRKAARMVGELGVEGAIPQLIEMMNNDPDEQVRQNARYALGMFAAFNNAVTNPDEATRSEAISAVQKMFETGDIGKEPSLPDATLRNILFGLSGLLVLLVIANLALLLLAGDGDSTPVVDPANATDVPLVDAATLAQNAQDRITLLEQNVTGLRAKFTPVMQGNQPGPEACPFGYTSATPLIINQENRLNYPNLAAIYESLNNTLATFDDANTLADNACLDVEPITADRAINVLNAITTFQQDAPNLRQQLSDITAASGPTPIPTETPIPTATPDYSQNIAQIYNLIDEMTGARGPYTLLNQYWTEAQQNAGITNGCRNARPTIPPDVTLSQEQSTSSESLRLAVENVNLGLDALRQAWDNFEQSCSQGDLVVASNATTGLATVQTVKAAFDTADLYLQELRGITPG